MSYSQSARPATRSCGTRREPGDRYGAGANAVGASITGMTSVVTGPTASIVSGLYWKLA